MIDAPKSYHLVVERPPVIVAIGSPWVRQRRCESCSYSDLAHWPARLPRRIHICSRGDDVYHVTWPAE